MPLVTDLFNGAMAAAGVAISHHMCEHFPYSRTELFAIIKAKKLKTFDEIIRQYGSGTGCEVCKPAVTSILAALWNETISDAAHHTLQDTNDRFLANMQRGGLYSVIPRVPGGEITPDKLIALGETARDYGLYTKITGGQRIDLFGAQLQNLPDIWEKLVDAGFESGHAYGKALRTVKSCVGTTWCRYGVQDSVAFAVRVENRYKGIRAPHKIKSAVSGCVRECAEAQGKDFGPGGHRARLQPVRRRQRRRQAPARRPAGRRRRRGNRHPLYRPLPHVLHHDRRQADPHRGVARQDGGRRGTPARGHHRRQARHLRRARFHDAVPGRLVPLRVGRRGQRSRKAAAVPAIREHRRHRADHRNRLRARPTAAGRLADGSGVACSRSRCSTVW